MIVDDVGKGRPFHCGCDFSISKSFTLSRVQVFRRQLPQVGAFYADLRNATVTAWVRSLTLSLEKMPRQRVFTVASDTEKSRAIT